MKKPFLFLVPCLLVLATVGAGCVRATVAPTVSASEPPEPIVATPEPTVSLGLYKDWDRVELAGVVSFYIPPTCLADIGSETAVIVCPTKTQPTPVPSMYMSFRKNELNISRWEDLEWEGWDDVIASLRIQTPLPHELVLTIQK